MLLSDNRFVRGERGSSDAPADHHRTAVWLGIYLSRQSAAQLWALAARLLKSGAWALLVFAVFVGAIYLCLR